MLDASTTSRRALELRDALQRVIRASGALDPDRTACGVELPPSHAHALMVLAQSSERALSQRDVARALGLDKSSVARLCQKMTEAGHLEQSRDPDDARFVRLVLTAKGRRAASTVERASLDRHDRLLAAIPRAERARVVSALETLADAMSGLAPGAGDE
ncbi:MAG: MarR family winged helix-turn-helix transcriptional regulator [Myxococcota bacterium]|nr:MarR family winged helix-turn-helix transcriptional regulator [Myxococcota bacterium]